MLPFQVGAIDPPSLRYGAASPNRPGNKGTICEERAVRVNRLYLRRVLLVLLSPILMGVLIAAPQVSGQAKGRKKRAATSAKAGASPAEQSLTNIPLPIGHEAKGLVLPDFDTEGRLKGRFEAGTAHRIDQEHVGFQHLRITTYTPESQPDLRIDMQTSVLDLKTRILSSQERTTIQRSDFNIAGDSVQFDTNTKTGRLIGNVKMVITDKSHLTAKPNTTE
jgi:hypothetical protein